VQTKRKVGRVQEPGNPSAKDSAQEDGEWQTIAAIFWRDSVWAQRASTGTNRVSQQQVKTGKQVALVSGS
jgi:hypothetical protein